MSQKEIIKFHKICLFYIILLNYVRSVSVYYYIYYLLIKWKELLAQPDVRIYKGKLIT